MLKRRVGLLALVIAALLLSGCGNAANGSASGRVGGDDGKITIGWSVALFNHPFYQKMMKGAQAAAADQGIELLMVDGKGDPAIQSDQLNNFIAQKVDGIILSAAISDPMIPAIKAVNDAKIPFEVLDRRIATQGSGITWDVLVSWDMVKSGAIGGEQIVKALGGKGKIAVVEGSAGAGSTIDRGEGFYGVLKKNPGMEVVYKGDGNFTRTDGQRVTEAILQRFPAGKLDGIYFMADDMAYGGLQAIKSAGRLGEFPIVSVDGQKEAMDLMRAGEIQYEAMAFPQDSGHIGVTVLSKMLKGEKPDLAKQQYEGRKAGFLQFEGLPWVRPDVYPVDKSNMKDEEFLGW